MKDEKTETEPQYSEGEDWIEGRTAQCPNKTRWEGGDEETVRWEPETGTVCCSECTYINPDATAAAVGFLLSEREANAGVVKTLHAALDEVAKVVGYEGMGDDPELPALVRGEFARMEEYQGNLEKADAEKAAKIEKLEKELAASVQQEKAARAKPSKAKPAEKPEEVKDAVSEVGESNGVRSEVR